VPTDSAFEPLILLVENDPDSCSALTKLLEAHGFVVNCAATVAEALALLDRYPTHVILDLMLPDGCGSIVLQYIRATVPWTRVAILSAWVDPLVDKLQPHLILDKKNTDIERLMAWLREAYQADVGTGVG
jgi:two-component system OmpR family response regulator